MPFEWIFWTTGTSFTAKLTCWPIEPGSLHVSSHDGVNNKDLYDDGAGNLTGDGIGTIDYSYGVVSCDFTTPLPASGTPILATYEPVEGGCSDICGSCPTNKIRLSLTPGTIAGQGEILIGLAWARLMEKIRRDVLPAHVEILTETFSEYYVASVGHRFDIIPADVEELDMHGLKVVFDSTEW